MSNSKSIDTEGTILFNDPILPQDREFRTWYRVIGDIKSGKRPLVAIHGGPGANHEYLLLGQSDIPAKTGRALIVYDQIGNGKSTHIPDKINDTSFWTMKLFTAELDNLLSKLGVKSDFDLVGHSWGGMVAAEYAIAYSSGLKHLILSSTPASLLSWSKAINARVDDLPTDTKLKVRELDEKEAWTDEEYQGPLNSLQKKHICRLDPWPVEVENFFGAVLKDPTVYFTLLGPSQLRVLGSLRGRSNFCF